MTARERNLLILFFVALGSAGIFIGLGSYWEELARLDEEFISLQKRALKVTQSARLLKPQDGTGLKDRFFEAGTMPDSLLLAAETQSALKSSGLSIQESRVIENTDKAHWVQYVLQGRITDWFQFLRTVRQQDPKVLFRTLSLVSKPGFTYAISFEVGHVVLP